MTSTPVMSFGNVQTVDYPGLTQTNNRVQNSDFQNFLNESKSNETQNLSKDNKPKEIKAEEVKEPKEIKTDKKVEKVAETSKEEGTAVREVTEEETDAVMEAVKKVVEILEEKFQVSLEDIEDALENLSCTMISLLDTAKLPEIVAALTESEDVLALATDENLYSSLKEITTEVTETVENLSKDLDIPVKELEAAVEKFEIPENLESIEETELPDIMGNVAKTDTKSSETKEQVTEPKTFEEKISITTNSGARKNDEGVKKPVTTAIKTETEFEAPEKIEISKEFKNDFESHENPSMTFAENLISKTVAALNETETAISYTSFDVENIMNQITEGIDVNLSADITEISLRLHPESLGNVTVKITQNNEGLLTAKFTAQNESVKAVIESQAVALKETLESKGVTVEAVEVAVQSHQFERNLSDQNRGQGKSDTPKKKGIRRINLSEDEAVSLDDGDRVLKEVMAQNGNTVDYSA